MKGVNKKILISACLLGNPVRYDGTDLLIHHPLLTQWQQQNKLISICPEVAGGMPTPRPPAEIQKADAHSVLLKTSKVVNYSKEDVTEFFILGAKKTLELAVTNNCGVAIMTERSPSCGSNEIYDGTFTGTVISGLGVTSALLEQHGIRVFNQYQLNAVEEYLNK